MIKGDGWAGFIMDGKLRLRNIKVLGIFMPDKAGRSEHDAVFGGRIYTALFAARYCLYAGKVSVLIPAIRFD